jgi:uncharacterized protein (UPF0332 family)
MNAEDIRQLVQGRIEQAVESLADAKTLLTTGRSGRSVVNRSYYAMFYCVLALWIFELRQVDDYKKIGPVSLDEAQEAIAVAEQFLTAVRTYLTTGGYLPQE